MHGFQVRLLMSKPILVIIIAELFGTSLWFSANSASDNLTKLWMLNTGDIGLLTNAVQLGFIVGTLFFSLGFHFYPLIQHQKFQKISSLSLNYG